MSAGWGHFPPRARPPSTPAPLTRSRNEPERTNVWSRVVAARVDSAWGPGGRRWGARNASGAAKVCATCVLFPVFVAHRRPPPLNRVRSPLCVRGVTQFSQHRLNAGRHARARTYTHLFAHTGRSSMLAFFVRAWDPAASLVEPASNACVFHIHIPNFPPSSPSSPALDTSPVLLFSFSSTTSPAPSARSSRAHAAATAATTTAAAEDASVSRLEPGLHDVQLPQRHGDQRHGLEHREPSDARVRRLHRCERGSPETEGRNGGKRERYSVSRGHEERPHRLAHDPSRARPPNTQPRRRTHCCDGGPRAGGGRSAGTPSCSADPAGDRRRSSHC